MFTEINWRCFCLVSERNLANSRVFLCNCFVSKVSLTSSQSRGTCGYVCYKPSLLPFHHENYPILQSGLLFVQLCVCARSNILRFSFSSFAQLWPNPPVAQSIFSPRCPPPEMLRDLRMSLIEYCLFRKAGKGCCEFVPLITLVFVLSMDLVLCVVLMS